MLSLDICKKILSSEGNKYTVDELKLIRDFVFLLAELQIENNNIEN